MTMTSSPSRTQVLRKQGLIESGFALATADGTLRVTGCQHMSPIVIPDAQQRAIDGLAGPFPGRGDGPRRTLVGSADGRLTVVEHP
jgi:hypothetical protein